MTAQTVSATPKTTDFSEIKGLYQKKKPTTTTSVSLLGLFIVVSATDIYLWTAACLPRHIQHREVVGLGEPLDRYTVRTHINI